MTTTTNPVQINIPAMTQGSIICVANASLDQKVTLSWPGLPSPIVFSGANGVEGGKMTLPDGSDVYLIPASPNPFTISAHFQYSDGSGFVDATVITPKTFPNHIFYTVVVGTEDGTDNDDDDTMLTITTVS